MIDNLISLIKEYNPNTNEHIIRKAFEVAYEKSQGTGA